MDKNSLTWVFTCKEVDFKALENLYQQAPLGNKSAKDLQIAFQNSMFVSFLYDNNTLIGAGRAVADGVDVAYLCDIALLPKFQGYGLGSDIVQKLLDLTKHHKKILLYSVVGKENFYKQFGFRGMKTAMAIFKEENKACTDGYID